MKYIQMLNELKRSDIALAGGKGANLGALIQAGLPVPPGFCLTTQAYSCFVSAGHLEAQIQALVAQTQPEDLSQLEAASLAIRQLFEQTVMPADIAGEISEAYRSLAAEAAPVAVRSSATAEDLPDLSFAGQQDTLLNIIGEPELLSAVVRCWASLWTARAIGYRARNHIDQANVALAVVVQHMVPSETAGVLFTANPLTGKRSETVIDATLGLGEALVSGMVEPDHYVVEMSESHVQILKKTLGSKALAVRGLAGGGTRVVAESSAAVQALPDPQILEMAHLGRKAEQFFGAPQDMEWGWADGRLYVLQSRAITSLYPLPQHGAAHPLDVYFSFASWQGMLQPITPLGQDSFTGLVAGIGRIFGSHSTAREQTTLLNAADRLFVNITGLIRSPLGRNIARMFIGSIDPISAGILEELIHDPRLALNTTRVSLAARLRLVRPLMPLVGGVLYNLVWPARGRNRLEVQIGRMLARARTEIRQAKTISERLSVIQGISDRAPSFLLPYLLPGIISGQAPLQILLKLSEAIADGPQLTLELTRGLPHNVTTEMDLQLWAVSRAIRSDEPASRHFQATSAETLAAEYLAGRLPPVAQQALAGFLEIYGMRGVAEIDIFRARWKEEPRHIIQVLQSYLEMEEGETSPDMVFRSGAERARLAGEALVAGLRHTRFGAIKASLARFLISRTRELGGLRETPKFSIVRTLDVTRHALRSTGVELAASGLLARSDDIFFLHLWELKDLVEGALPAAQELVERRRQSFERETSRRRVPRILLSDGTTYYEGIQAAPADGENVLTGSPVSAGTVEGTVRVILNPHGTRLLPGEILVCPATDPAWTPLFLSAGGLVMEVGGMMTHGSVVAREYGIPAVVGVTQATTRLKSGQRVRVDGSLGRVQILQEVAVSPSPD